MTDLALSGGIPQTCPRLQESALASQSQGTVSILTGPDAYAELRDEWTALAARQPDPACFQAPDLLAVWSRHFAGNAADLRTVVVRTGQQPALIWPLQLCRKGPVMLASAAGAPIAQFDKVFVDPDCDRAAVFAQAMATVRAEIRPDLISFTNLRQDSWLVGAIGPAAVQIDEAEGAPFADTSRSIEDLLAGLKTRVQKQQRKRMEKFATLGVSSFQVAEEADQAEEWLGEILAMKRKWLVATGRMSRAFSDPRTAGCLRDMARSLSSPASSPRFVISRLTLDGAIAAMEVGITHRGVYHLYIGAFSEELARFGPGNVLTEKMLEWCHANGIARYDMMPPRTRNKSEWQSGETEVASRILPLTRAGEAYVAVVARRLAPALRNSFYRLPDRWRSAITERKLRI